MPKILGNLNIRKSPILGCKCGFLDDSSSLRPERTRGMAYPRVSQHEPSILAHNGGRGVESLGRQSPRKSAKARTFYRENRVWGVGVAKVVQSAWNPGVFFL